MNTTILTVHSREPRSWETYYRPAALIKSLERLNCAPVILGYNDPTFCGLMSKPFMYRNWLRANKPSDHVILCDAWDVIFTEHPDSLVERCRALYGDSIVFNAEKGCWPRADLADKFPDTGTPWRYLNSGFMCGQAERILELLEALNIESIGFDRPNPDGGSRIEPNDQGEFQRLFTEQPVPMVLDGRCEIAQAFSACGPDEFEFSAAGVKNKLTGTTPGCLHTNGNSKNEIAPIIIQNLNL
jgi:hypothetical protein